MFNDVSLLRPCRCPSSHNQEITLYECTHWVSFKVLVYHLSWLSKVSRQLQQLPCLWGSYCGWTPPPHPPLHSDWAKRGAVGRSRWRRWCTVAGSLVGSVSRLRLLLRPSWRTGRSRQQWSSTGGMARRWTGRARSEPGGGCLQGREEVGRCGTSLQVWSPWLLPW